MVLEAKFSNQGADNPGKRQLLCVVGIPVFVHSIWVCDPLFILLNMSLCVPPLLIHVGVNWQVAFL